MLNWERMQLALVQCSPRLVREKLSKKMKCFEWYKRFKEDRENMEDNERGDRPRSHRTDVNAEKMKNLYV